MTVPHPLMRQLAAARQQAGLSLDEWSARLGMQLSTVSYLERGISSPSLAALERLAGDLGYEVVLRKADDPQGAPTAPEPPFRVPETLRARHAREAAERLLTLVDEVRDVMAYFDGQLTALATLHPTHADALRTTYRKLDALLAAPTAPAQPAMHTGGNAEDCPVCQRAIDWTVLYPWICPGAGAEESAQPATGNSGDTEASEPPAPLTDDLSALREQVADALRGAFDTAITAEWICCDPVRTDHDLCSRADIMRKAVRGLLTDDPDYDIPLMRSAVLDAVMDVIRPVLERRCSCDSDPIECQHEAARGHNEAEITRLTAFASEWAAKSITEGQRADRAERELNRLKSAQPLPSTPRDSDEDTCPAESTDEQAQLCTEIAARLHDLHHPGSTTFADMAHAAMAYVTTEQAHTRHWQQRAEQAEAGRDQYRARWTNQAYAAEQVLAKADRYRTAWWSARIRAAKQREQANNWCQISINTAIKAPAKWRKRAETAESVLNQIRQLHSRHECDDSECRLCWGLIPVCAAGCAECPCPTMRALDQAQSDAGPCDGCETCELATELAEARADIDRVRRLCELTINCSVRVQAVEQARDTLAVLDRTTPDEPGPNRTEPDATGGDQ